MNEKSVDSQQNLENSGYEWFLLALLPLGFISYQFIQETFFRPSVSLTSEAKQYVASMNRAQQAFFAEKNTFGKTMGQLGIGLKSETKNYQYSIQIAKKAVFNYGVSKNPKWTSYVGAVFSIPTSGNDQVLHTETILCQATSPGTIEPERPTYQNGKVLCGKGTKEVTR